jgi:hypothetical protein
VGCLPEEGLTAWSTRILGKRLVRHRSDGAAEWLWEVDRMPEKGVSGGPLLDDRGYLIGIAGGVSDGRGYYCHAAGIHRFLKVNGLKWLFSG